MVTTPRNLGAEQPHVVLLCPFEKRQEKVIFFDYIGRKWNTIKPNVGLRVIMLKYITVDFIKT